MEKQSKLIPVFKLGDVVKKDVDTAWNSSVEFRKLDRRFLARVIRAIHGIPLLIPQMALPELEVYIGRSSFNTIIRRFASHGKQRGHLYGAMLFDAHQAIALDAEKAGIALVKELERLDGVCVGNLKVHSGGAIGKGRQIVYMTWGLARTPAVIRIPTTDELEIAAERVAIKSKWAVDAKEVRTALRSLRTRRPKKVLRWLPRYRRS